MGYYAKPCNFSFTLLICTFLYKLIRLSQVFVNSRDFCIIGAAAVLLFAIGQALHSYCCSITSINAGILWALVLVQY
jgi:hypothetical protein